MALKRMVLQIGMGTDIRGSDDTKAAVRAVEDAIHHSSLVLLKTLDLDPGKMLVDVRIGVQQPEKVDPAAVKAVLPHGQITVEVVKGGLNAANTGPDDISIIAVAAITVHLDLA